MPIQLFTIIDKFKLFNKFIYSTIKKKSSRSKI